MDDASALQVTPDRLAGLVTALLDQKGLGAVGPDRDLRDAGLRSMDVFNLMLSIEEEFAIVIPQDQMTPENFRSTMTIRRLLTRLGV